MSQSSNDEKSKSSSEKEVCSFSDSEEDNPEFCNKQILFESGSTKDTDKDKNETTLVNVSKPTNVKINKSKTMIYNPLNLKKSIVNISLEKDNNFNSERDMQIKNMNSFKRRGSYSKKKILPLTLIGKEKSKVPSKRTSLFEKIKEKNAEKPVRKDKNGTVINKKNKKKVKITFNIPIEDVEYIESFKKFNVIHGIPKNDYYVPQKDNCQCCQIW